MTMEAGVGDTEMLRAYNGAARIRPWLKLHGSVIAAPDRPDVTALDLFRSALPEAPALFYFRCRARL